MKSAAQVSRKRSDSKSVHRRGSEPPCLGIRLAPPDGQDKPDDAVLFDLLSQWAPDATERHRILVENPAKLYGFA